MTMIEWLNSEQIQFYLIRKTLNILPKTKQQQQQDDDDDKKDSTFNTNENEN